MIRQAAYGVEPRRVREARLDLEVLAQSESVFALCGGHGAASRGGRADQDGPADGARKDRGIQASQGDSGRTGPGARSRAGVTVG